MKKELMLPSAAVGKRCASHVRGGLLKSNCICAINEQPNIYIYLHISIVYVCILMACQKKKNTRGEGEEEKGKVYYWSFHANGVKNKSEPSRVNGMTNEQGCCGPKCTKAAGYLGESQRTTSK